MNQRIDNERTMALARRLVAAVSPALRDDQLRPCFREFVAVLREGLEDYSRALRADEDRLRPGRETPPGSPDGG